jgi:hypothetical protein
LDESTQPKVVGLDLSAAGITGPALYTDHPRGVPLFARGLIGLLIIVAIVLFLLKVAVAGGIIGLIALIVLILLLLGRL